MSQEQIITKEQLQLLKDTLRALKKNCEQYIEKFRSSCPCEDCHNDYKFFKGAWMIILVLEEIIIDGKWSIAKSIVGNTMKFNSKYNGMEH